MSHQASAPHSIHERVLDDLRYIRTAVRSAEPFTAVSGLGGVAMGVIGLMAAAIAAPALASPRRWLAVWLAAAALATITGAAFTIHKIRRTGTPLLSGPPRRFALSLLPAFAAAALLTTVLAGRGAFDLLPALWLLLYGVAISAGGALSVRVVPFMGLALLAIGAVALFVPFQTANLLLGIGFGVVQIGGGVVIIRRYGG